MHYRQLIPWLLLLLFALAAACAAEPEPRLEPPIPAANDLFASRGGGDPRTAGYWLLWNSCAPDNRAETAAANGGRAAGWIILDDLLQDPGILLGEVSVASCQEGLNLLSGRDLSGRSRKGEAAYELAAQLLVAQLNLAAGASSCPAIDQAVQGGQLLLLSAGWDGSGRYLEQEPASRELETALVLTGQLDQYNSGLLCR
jgi:hypothetical protein